LDRPTSLILPDESQVIYEYDAFHLKKLQRINKSKDILYEIDCTYGLGNTVLKTKSPAGTTSFTYDLLGRAIAIESAQWKSYLESFDPIGNLLKMKQIDPSGTLENQFTYDRFDHLTSETGEATQQFTYDSVGNCLSKNEKAWSVNSLNQVEQNGDSTFTYDANGNIKTQSDPAVTYEYDALDRLTVIESETNRVVLSYDAFGRCLSIEVNSHKKNLLYQGEQEIGSMVDGKLKEFRVVHPELSEDRTFAIELDEETYFPIQDYRGNICALQNSAGTVSEHFRYSAFGLKLGQNTDCATLDNPWCFANRREVESLILFTHRFYNLNLMRWQTVDPSRFKESLNLYRYLKNNPFCYKDLNGEFAIQLELFFYEFGPKAAAASAAIVANPAFMPVVAFMFAAALAYTTYDICMRLDARLDTTNEPIVDEVNEDNNNGSRKKLKPDPNATGNHSTFRKDPVTGEITHYETYKPQINVKNPNAWEVEKRYDAKGKAHTNKFLGEKIDTPHVHDPAYPGGVRYPNNTEIP
jgi:RHS repeat-associated protein